MCEIKVDSVRKEANIYYDGKVTSRVLHMADGTEKTLGFVLPGTYEFSTESAEYMEIASGKGEIELVEDTISYKEGDTFTIPAETTFLFIAKEATDYCCTYLEK